MALGSVVQDLVAVRPEFLIVEASDLLMLIEDFANFCGVSYCVVKMYTGAR